jgi:hypothetical protein
MKTILRPDWFLIRSYDDLQVLTALALRSPRFSRTWLDVVRTWPSVKGVLSINVACFYFDNASYLVQFYFLQSQVILQKKLNIF